MDLYVIAYFFPFLIFGIFCNLFESQQFKTNGELVLDITAY